MRALAVGLPGTLRTYVRAGGQLSLGLQRLRMAKGDDVGFGEWLWRAREVALALAVANWLLRWLWRHWFGVGCDQYPDAHTYVPNGPRGTRRPDPWFKDPGRARKEGHGRGGGAGEGGPGTAQRFFFPFFVFTTTYVSAECVRPHERPAAQDPSLRPGHAPRRLRMTPYCEPRRPSEFACTSWRRACESQT